MKSFITIAKPLNQEFFWDEPQEQTFQKLKTRLSSTPFWGNRSKDGHSNHTWIGIL